MTSRNHKLINRFTLWFIVIVFLVTPLCMLFSYRDIHENQLLAETSRLQQRNHHAATLLQAQHTTLLNSLPVNIQNTDSLTGNDTTRPHTTLTHTPNENAQRITVACTYLIHGHYYTISSFTDMATVSRHWPTMFKVALWKTLLIAAVVAVSGRIISHYVLAPFYNTLHKLQTFSLAQKQPLLLPATNVIEFQQLHRFLTQMTQLAMEDYDRVKEFSENASHEVQTPLAVLQTKLELLTESCTSATQAVLIQDMQTAVNKISKINRSLILLTRLENKEYDQKEWVDAGRILQQILSDFEDQLQLSHIHTQTHINNNCKLHIHPVLLEILFRNLVSNAIRYNYPNGQLTVTLNNTYLEISNTGTPPGNDTALLFERFKKSNQHADSIGLGLSIVKQICQLNHFSVTYQYQNNIHILHVNF